MNDALRGFSASMPVRLRKSHLELAGSLLFTLLYVLFLSSPVWPDDAGIILKYMDNFADGYFYTYNPADGPVFGISSFLHGILAGVLAWSHLLSPAGSLLASNLLGLTLTAFFLLRILDHYLDHHSANVPLRVVAWLTILLTAPNWMKMAISGMETPLHVAVLLFCFYAVLQNYPRLTWVAFTLALLTKLDSAPIVAVLGLIFLWQNRRELRTLRGWRQLVQNGALFCGLPLAIWVLFSYRVLGGPLPQSAFAKLYFHVNPSTHPFPYVETLINKPMGQAFMLLFLALGIGYALQALLRSGHKELPVLMAGLACVGYFALYYYYNPAEQHPWYYAIPEILMRLQIVIAGVVLAQHYWPRWGTQLSLAVCGSLLVIGGTFATQEVSQHNHMHEVLESERMEIGTWIRQESAPDDVLLAAHGHIAREAGLYTIDFSGLNSPIVTDYARNLALLVRDLRPDWIALQEIDEPWMREYGYVLERSFYNVTTVGFPAWRIYHRTEDARPTRLVSVNAEEIETDEHVVPFWMVPVNAIGTHMTLHVPDAASGATAFTAGVMHKPTAIRVTAVVQSTAGETLLEEVWETAAAPRGNVPAQPTTELRIELDPAWQVGSIMVTSTAADSGDPLSFQLISPAFIVPAFIVEE